MKPFNPRGKNLPVTTTSTPIHSTAHVAFKKGGFTEEEAKTTAREWQLLIPSSERPRRLVAIIPSPNPNTNSTHGFDRTRTATWDDVWEENRTQGIVLYPTSHIEGPDNRHTPTWLIKSALKMRPNGIIALPTSAFTPAKNTAPDSAEESSYLTMFAHAIHCGHEDSLLFIDADSEQEARTAMRDALAAGLIQKTIPKGEAAETAHEWSNNFHYLPR